MIKLRIKNLWYIPKFNVGYILDLVGWRMFSRKLLKLNGTPESLPTAWGLNIDKNVCQHKKYFGTQYQWTVRKGLQSLDLMKVKRVQSKLRKNQAKKVKSK